jgi:hypothetical protein
LIDILDQVAIFSGVDEEFSMVAVIDRLALRPSYRNLLWAVGRFDIDSEVTRCEVASMDPENLPQ